MLPRLRSFPLCVVSQLIVLSKTRILQKIMVNFHSDADYTPYEVIDTVIGGDNLDVLCLILR
jgi:hypothetical protein